MMTNMIVDSSRTIASLALFLMVSVGLGLAISGRADSVEAWNVRLVGYFDLRLVETSGRGSSNINVGV